MLIETKTFADRVEHYRHGVLHRDGDEPAIEYNDGSKEYYRGGLLHRDGDEPAIETSNGLRIWAKHGLYHREGGEPAVTLHIGSKLFQAEWWVNDEMLDSAEFNAEETYTDYEKRVGRKLRRS